MRQGTYYLNNSGHSWVTYPKEKVLVFHGAEAYCKQRTVDHYEMFGNSSVTCFKYKNKMIKVFPELIGNKIICFVDYKEKY